jgi:DNA-binding NarL/FixJ family response regulator
MSRRVLVADPNDVMRAKIRSLIEKAGWEVVGEAADGQECIEKVDFLTPDLVILDLSMPVKNAIQAAAEIRTLRRSTKLLVFTVHDSDVVRDEVLRAGIDGFAVKSSSSAELLSEAARLLDLRP